MNCIAAKDGWGTEGDQVIKECSRVRSGDGTGNAGWGFGFRPETWTSTPLGPCLRPPETEHMYWVRGRAFIPNLRIIFFFFPAVVLDAFAI